MSSDGTISTKKIISEEQQITKNTVSEHNSIVANNLTINGNTILGDSEAEDTLVVNSKPVFNSAVEFKQSISVSGDIQYAGLDAIRDNIVSINTELAHAKSTYPSIDDRITDQVKIVQDSIDLFATRRDNPNEVTLTQSILADGTTDITSVEMETLTNGSNADGLHTHEKYDTFMEQSNISAIYGQFNNISERIDNSEQIINNINTEVTNARQSYTSIDGRLDDMSTLVLSHDDSIVGNGKSLRALDLRIKFLEANTGNIVDEDIDWSTFKGDPGANGKSAYEVAVDNGFVGTEQEWLDSLIPNPYVPPSKLWYTATSPIIDSANGEKQKFTADADATIEIEMNDGDSITLIFNPSTFTITWPAITWFGGLPTFDPDSSNAISLNKDGADIYGWQHGSA